MSKSMAPSLKKECRSTRHFFVGDTTLGENHSCEQKSGVIKTLGGSTTLKYLTNMSMMMYDGNICSNCPPDSAFSVSSRFRRQRKVSACCCQQRRPHNMRDSDTFHSIPPNG